VKRSLLTFVVHAVASWMLNISAGLCGQDHRLEARSIPRVSNDVDNFLKDQGLWHRGHGPKRN
jgi:hypothetical protein